MVKIYRKYTRAGTVNIVKVTQNMSYSHFHVPVPDKLVGRSLILVEQRLTLVHGGKVHQLKSLFIDKQNYGWDSRIEEPYWGSSQ